MHQHTYGKYSIAIVTLYGVKTCSCSLDTAVILCVSLCRTNRPDLGFRIVCEQVSHHPPVSAFHADSEHFVLQGSILPKLKFWGKSVEVTPKGLVTLHLLRFRWFFSLVSHQIYHVQLSCYPELSELTIYLLNRVRVRLRSTTTCHKVVVLNSFEWIWDIDHSWFLQILYLYVTTSTCNTNKLALQFRSMCCCSRRVLHFLPKKLFQP